MRTGTSGRVRWRSSRRTSRPTRPHWDIYRLFFQQYGSSPYTSQHSTSYILSLCFKIRLVSSVNYKTYLLHLISCDANRILGLAWAWSDTPARTLIVSMHNKEFFFMVVKYLRIASLQTMSSTDLSFLTTSSSIWSSSSMATSRPRLTNCVVATAGVAPISEQRSLKFSSGSLKSNRSCSAGFTVDVVAVKSWSFWLGTFVDSCVAATDVVACVVATTVVACVVTTDLVRSRSLYFVYWDNSA